jgi:hypothetical protein
MNSNSHMRIARTLCLTLISLSFLSACNSTESSMSQWWYDQRWEQAKD